MMCQLMAQLVLQHSQTKTAVFSGRFFLCKLFPTALLHQTHSLKAAASISTVPMSADCGKTTAKYSCKAALYQLKSDEMADA
jgi:hypothetical protein